MRKIELMAVGSVVLLIATVFLWYIFLRPQAKLDLVDSTIREAEEKEKAIREEQDRVLASHVIVLKPDWASLDREIEETKSLLKEVETVPPSTDPKEAKLLVEYKAAYAEMMVQLEKRRVETTASIIPLLRQRVHQKALDGIQFSEPNKDEIQVSTEKLDGPHFRLLMALLTKPGRLRIHACIEGLTDDQVNAIKESYQNIGQGDYKTHLAKVLPLDEYEMLQANKVDTMKLVVTRFPILDAPQILDAKPYKSTEGGHGVSVRMVPIAGQVFEATTKLLIKKQIALVIDDRVYMTPHLQGTVSDRFNLTYPKFTRDDGSYLIAVLLSRPLPVPLLVQSDTTK